MTYRRWRGLVWRIPAIGLVVTLIATACAGTQAKPTEGGLAQQLAATAPPEPTAVPRAENAATAVAQASDTTWDMTVPDRLS